MSTGMVIVCRNTQGDACINQWANASQENKYADSLSEIAGQTLVVAYDTLIPYVTFDHFDNGHLKLSGYLGELWTTLEHRLKFSSIYVRVNGNGARDLLLRGLADVYLSATVVTVEEDDDFGHTQPVVTHWYQLFMRKGVPEVSADSYFRAMSGTMWVMTVAALVLLCLVLRGMVWLRTSLGMSAGVFPATASLGSCFMSVLGGLCSQGWQESPSCLSVRVTVVTTLFFGYLLYNAYAAVLISYLASGHNTAPFSSLEEVSRKGTHVLCVRNESYAYFTLKRNAQWQRVLNKGVCQDAAHADRLAEGLCKHNTVALEIPSVMAAALDDRPECQNEVLRVRGRMQRASASLLLRPDFPHTQAIDYMITRCRASGILDRLEKRYLDGLAVQKAGASAGQDSYSSSTPTTGVQVSLDHVRWVLGLYICFLGVPVVLLAVECLVAWKARKRTRARRRRPPESWPWAGA